VKLSKIQERCHQQAIDMGFYGGVPTTYDGGLEAQAHLWKQLCHLFIEIGELYDAHINVIDTHTEVADVAIVLLDLMSFLQVSVNVGESVIDWLNDNTEPWEIPFFNAASMANGIRKYGLQDRSDIAYHADVILQSLCNKKQLKKYILEKLDINLTRGKRYGVVNEDC
jgi:hypothetical protein